MGERGDATQALATHGEGLRHLVRTDADPRVRQRGQALLRVAEGHPVAAVARLLHVRPNRIRAWCARFLAEGRSGLTDRPRRGRPPKLDAADYHFLQHRGCMRRGRTVWRACYFTVFHALSRPRFRRCEVISSRKALPYPRIRNFSYTLYISTMNSTSLPSGSSMYIVREGMTGCWPVRIAKPCAARWSRIASKSAGASSKAR